MILHEGVLRKSFRVANPCHSSCQSLAVRSAHPVTFIEGNKACLMETLFFFSLEEK